MRDTFGVRVLAALVILTVHTAGTAAAVPHLVGPVSDHAGLLTSEEEARITSFLLGQERETSSQIAVLTVESLDGLSDVEYAQEVFSAWKLGQADPDNGVLLLISKSPRRVRIHAGYGVEGALPDGLCGAIIRQEIKPRLKAGAYFDAVDRGIRAIDRAIHGEYAAQPDSPAVWTQWLLAGIFFGGFGALASGRVGRDLLPVRSLCISP